MDEVPTAWTAQNGAATDFAFAALCRAVEALSKAGPEYNSKEDAQPAARVESIRRRLEQLAGLAHAGLMLVEGNRASFTAEGLHGDSHDFWYTLALAVIEGPLNPGNSPSPPPELHKSVKILYDSLLRFLPYACVRAGDCAVRTADALEILYSAFPLDELRESTREAHHAASISARLLSAVNERVGERYLETHGGSVAHLD